MKLTYFFAQILDKNSLHIPKTPATPTTLHKTLNIVLVVMGALAFLMLVIAGFRYTISQGDPAKVADSKRMIVYTLVGLLVIAFAATIVNFVLVRV